MNRKTNLLLSAAVALFVATAPAVFAQNVASQKAYFGHSTEEILAPQGGLILDGYIKTSGVGDLLIGVSLECALWTGTSNTATKGGGKTTSKSRAAVNVTVMVDDAVAIPGQVVYCDREQEVNLTFSSLTAEITDSITLELFLRTKNANHFNFYGVNPGSGVHYVHVYADSILEDDGQQVVIDNTRAVVGKRTLVVEEYNNP